VLRGTYCVLRSGATFPQVLNLREGDTWTPEKPGCFGLAVIFCASQLLYALFGLSSKISKSMI